ncbi:MAG: hypothetical protein ABTA16_11765, partial [Niallia sp.]
FLREELEKHAEITPITSKMVLSSIVAPTNKDIIIFFNRNDDTYSNDCQSFLKLGTELGAKILPISITQEYRIPPSFIPDPQSYDVYEALERRRLTSTQIQTIAIAFARDVISILQPTLSRRNMSLFISHRRLDGEEIAGGFYDAFCQRAQESFRDLSNILVGENAQEIIEMNLRKSDAVVFLDTPLSGESTWIELELKIALTLNLPIVWVKLGKDTNRVKLKIKPADSPHFKFPEVNIDRRKVNPDIVDSVIHKAFEISRENAKNIFGHLQRMRDLHQEGKINLEILDQQNYMFQVKIPRRGYRYVQRPMTHLISFYGRIPKDDDKLNFNNLINQQGYSKHPRFGHLYDAALMLAPMASQNNQEVIEDPHFIDCCDDYVSSLELFSNDKLLTKNNKSGVIISGAFPDCSPEYQQALWNALTAFVQTTLDRKGTVIFGAHPTFQQIIFDIAKIRRPYDFKESVHLFISKHFVTQANINEISSMATVTGVDQVENDRSKSLTEMRKAMISHENAACMIVIGGKTQRPGIPPGVDEEVSLAKSLNIPIFFIGSVGGRAAEIASDLHNNGWKNKPNQLSEQLNQELMVSPDYSRLATKLFDTLGL